MAPRGKDKLYVEKVVHRSGDRKGEQVADYSVPLLNIDRNTTFDEIVVSGKDRMREKYKEPEMNDRGDSSEDYIF